MILMCKQYSRKFGRPVLQLRDGKSSQVLVEETWVQSLGSEDPLEEDKATHSSILVWRISWAEESGSLQSMPWQRVGHE